LLLIILIIWIFYSRKIQKKNEALVDRILAQEKDRTEIEKLRKIAQDNAGTVAEDDEIFIRLEKLMQEQKPYTETECNRKTLAEAVGTNEKYLSDSIKNNTGLPVSEYIMKYRLKHANTLLLRPSAEYTIDAVAIDSGFGSRSKFHEHYRNHYGITPNEFRKTIQAKKE
jgi:AraC-like DNA-binding protein